MIATEGIHDDFTALKTPMLAEKINCIKSELIKSEERVESVNEEKNGTEIIMPHSSMQVMRVNASHAGLTAAIHHST